MPDATFWNVQSVLFILFALLLAVLLFDGAYQVATQRPPLLLAERWIRKRVPATPADCALQGTAKVMQAAALALLTAPSALFSVINSAGQPFPPVSRLPVGVEVMVAVALIGSWVLSAVFLVLAFAVSQRVKYVPVDPKVIVE